MDWIATASQKVDITEYKLKYWEKDAQKGKLSVAIKDLYNNFLYLSVEPWTVYSNQFMVKTSGMFWEYFYIISIKRLRLFKILVNEN